MVHILHFRVDKFIEANHMNPDQTVPNLGQYCLQMRAQGSHRLGQYLNLEGFLEKSLKIKSVLKSTGKSLKSLEKSLISTFFCRT